MWKSIRLSYRAEVADEKGLALGSTAVPDVHYVAVLHNIVLALEP